MKLYPPLKRAKYFGWDHELKDLNDFNRCIVQRFGETLIDYTVVGLKAHNGIDIPLADGTEVFASHDGVVTYAGGDAKAGIGVTVKADGYKTVYWHLKDVSVSVGQGVKAGELIGHGDSTGWSTGPHLHWGLKLLDINGEVLDRDNGFDGAVDPYPYLVWFDNMSESDVKALQALEGYHDPDGVQFWTGKPLSEYLKVRLADKVKTIEEAQYGK